MNEPVEMKVTDRRAASVIEAQPEFPAAISASPVDALLTAINRHPNMDLAKLEKLTDLVERWRAVEAKRAYVAAFSNAKRSMPPVIKDMLNKQYGSDYSSLANLVNTVSQHLGHFGLHANWNVVTQSEEVIKLKCTITHVDGHSEEVQIAGPMDASGTKNPLQAVKSTLTYLEGATFQAITGVVAKSGSTDDDGRGSHQPEEAKKPEGYEKWNADMTALAEEGHGKLEAAFEKSAGEFRRYAVKEDSTWWAQTKSKARKADAQKRPAK